MPELPEVETVRRGLEPVMTGHVIATVEARRAGLRYPFPGNLAAALTGAKVAQLSRRAKYLLIHLDNQQVLIIHLGMSGRIAVIRPGEDYQLQKHDHLVLTLGDGGRVILNDPRRFGIVDLTAASQLDHYPAFKNLGPEPLANQFSGPVLAAALAGRRNSIKAALLDQRIVAGLGNIYVCEALYQAAISPLRIAGAIEAAEADLLAAAIRDVLNRALAAGGSSLRDYRKADGELGYFQHQFAVYNREGQPCPYCDCEGRRGNVIQRAIQHGRSTFYCPAHQK